MPVLSLGLVMEHDMTMMNLRPTESELYLLQLTGHSAFPFPDASTGTATYRVGRAAQGVLDNQANFNNRRAELTADKMFTTEGRTVHLARAGHQYLQNIDGIDRTLADIPGLIVELRKQLRVQPPPGDATVREVRAGEIRAWFRSLNDNLAVGQHILDEATNGGQELLFAYRSAPHGTVPPVDSRVLAEAENIVAERSNADVARQVRELVEAFDFYQKLRDAVREEISEAIGIEPEPRLV